MNSVVAFSGNFETKVQALISLVLAGALLISVTARGAVIGDVLSAAVEPNGWVLDVVVNTTNTNVVPDYGFPNQPLGAFTLVGVPPGKVVLSTTSAGFDDSASVVSLSRTLYGTRTLRFPYGTNGQTTLNYVRDVTSNGSVTTVRVSLSDYVYSTDSNLLLSVGGNWYLTNAPIVNLPVVNNSTNLAGRVVANWSRVPWQRVTNNIATVACVAFGHGAQQGRPVRCVQFWAVDEANNVSPTNTVVSPTIDSSQGDAVQVIEYVGHIDCATLSQSNRLTVHFAAYPWIGDSNSVLNTSDGRFNFPSLEAAPTKLFLDKNNSYPVQIAVVSPSGSDASGVIVNASNFSTNNPPPAFATTGAAALAIARTNRDFYGASMRENGAGIIYLQPGSHVLGTTSLITLTNYPKTWMTIAPFPGVDRSQAVIAKSVSTSGNFVSQMTRISNCTILCTNGNSLFGQTDFLWFDHCLFSSNSTIVPIIDNCTNWYVTQCVVQELTQGLIPYQFRNSNIRLIRGNDISDMTHDWFASTFIGNLRATGTNGAARSDWTASPFHEAPSFPIIAFNKLLCENGNLGGDIIKLAVTGSYMRLTNGAAVVQNLIEQVNEASAGIRCLSTGSSSQNISDTNNANNILCWNNTMVGQRLNWMENAGSPSVAAQRNNTSLLNNIFDNINSKDDLDYTANGIRTGNWPVMFGVGSAANTDLDPANMDGGWHWHWFGLNSISNKSSQGSGLNSTWATYFNYVNRQSGTVQNISDVAHGGGDYHLRSTSPLWQLKTQWLLPFDIDGVPRSPSDPPGAFAARSINSTLLESPLFPNKNFSVGYQTQIGATYFLQYLSDLTSTNWQVLTNSAGNGNVQTFIDPLPADPRRFYRLLITTP